MLELLGKLLSDWFAVTVLVLPSGIALFPRMVELFNEYTWLAWLMVPVVVILGPSIAWIWWCWQAMDGMNTLKLLNPITLLAFPVAAIYGGGKGLAIGEKLGRKLDDFFQVPAYKRQDQIIMFICMMGLASAAYKTAKYVKNGRL